MQNFYFEAKADWGFEPDQTCFFENNLYYNVSAREINAVTEDPLFVDPTKGGTDILTYCTILYKK